MPSFDSQGKESGEYWIHLTDHRNQGHHRNQDLNPYLINAMGSQKYGDHAVLHHVYVRVHYRNCHILGY